MNFISYAQNFEDVMLWRALGHIERGTYIDIGAQDPLIDSVSLAFYERDWKGIHVEPAPLYAEMLRQQRQGDIVIQAAVGGGPEILKFYEIPDSGLSTGDASIAAQHRERGFEVREIAVSCVSLASVLDAAQTPEIHWLKIDVEGFEQRVLETWGESSVRPWVVVVESTLPMTQFQTHKAWEALLTLRGYTPVYFDGLNRYYVSDTHPELNGAFAVPPNVFDGFALNGTASAPYHHVIEQRFRQRIDASLAQAGEHQRQASEEIGRLSDSLIALREAHAEQERQWVAHRHEILARLEASESYATSLQHQAARDLNEHARQAAEQQRELLSRQAEREHAFAERERVYIDREREYSAREQVYIDREQARLENERAHVARELVLAERARAQQQAGFERQLQAVRVELGNVVRERAASESALRQEAARLQQRVELLLAGQTRREQEVAAQLADIHERAEQVRGDLARVYMERQNALQDQYLAREASLSEQLQAAQREIRHIANESAERERKLTARHGEALGLLEHALREQMQRALSISTQLLAVERKAEQDRIELIRQHDERSEAQRRLEVEREAARAREAQARDAQIAGLRDEVGELRHAQAVQDQRHSAETRAHEAAQDHLAETYKAAEARLYGELLAEQQVGARLRESLADVQQCLTATHASFSWRITAPLRALFGEPVGATIAMPRAEGAAPIEPITHLQATTQDAAETQQPCATQPPEVPQTIVPASEAESVVQAHSSAHIAPQAITDRLTPFESIMLPSLIQASVSDPAVTLDALLAHHDQSFVQYAYQTLLGRDPDPEGLTYYLHRVRSGVAKIQILAQLRRSAEGGGVSVNLPGLDAAIERHRRAQHPVFGWLYRLFTAVEGNRPYERRLRRIENQLLLLGDESARRFGQLESALVGLQQLVGQQTQALTVAWQERTQGEGHAVPLAPALVVKNEQSVPELDGYSPRVRAMHVQLKRATKNQLRKVA